MASVFLRVGTPRRRPRPKRATSDTIDEVDAFTAPPHRHRIDTNVGARVDLGLRRLRSIAELASHLPRPHPSEVARRVRDRGEGVARRQGMKDGAAHGVDLHRGAAATSDRQTRHVRLTGPRVGHGLPARRESGDELGSECAASWPERRCALRHRLHTLTTGDPERVTSIGGTPTNRQHSVKRPHEDRRCTRRGLKVPFCVSLCTWSSIFGGGDSRSGGRGTSRAEIYLSGQIPDPHPPVRDLIAEGEKESQPVIL